MTETYKIADHVVAIDAAYPLIHRMCQKWKYAEEPQFLISCGEDALNRERRICAEVYPGANFSDGYLEMRVIHRRLSLALLDYGCIGFHSSALAMDGRGYAFTAPSGTGKSTHSRLWRECFGDRVSMVNDDSPYLQLRQDGVYVCGSPWMGKHRLGDNLSVPLKAIVLLNRGTENRIVPVTPPEAFGYLLKQTSLGVDPQIRIKVMDLMNRVTEQVKLYRLECNMEQDAARICYAEIGKEAENHEN